MSDEKPSPSRVPELDGEFTQEAIIQHLKTLTEAVGVAMEMVHVLAQVAEGQIIVRAQQWPSPQNKKIAAELIDHLHNDDWEELKKEWGIE